MLLHMAMALPPTTAANAGVLITKPASRIHHHRRSRTVGSATTATWSRVTADHESSGNSSSSSNHHCCDCYDDDQDDSSIHELIEATAQRWRQETAQTVRNTRTGAQFPNTVSALVELATATGTTTSYSSVEQHSQEEEEQYPPVTMLAIPPSLTYVHVRADEDDALTVDTALCLTAAGRPDHDDTPFR